MVTLFRSLKLLSSDHRETELHRGSNPLPVIKTDNLPSRAAYCKSGWRKSILFNPKTLEGSPGGIELTETSGQSLCNIRCAKNICKTKQSKAVTTNRNYSILGL